MKKRGIAISLMLLAMIVASCGNKDKNRQFNSFSVDDLPQLVVGDSVQGVAAPFAGMSGYELIVAGGCNFPEVPAAEGGEKRFYADIFALDIRDPHQ